MAPVSQAYLSIYLSIFSHISRHWLSKIEQAKLTASSLIGSRNRHSNNTITQSKQNCQSLFCVFFV